MHNHTCRALLWLSAVLQITSLLATANTSVHTSWMWHMHQPIYWPDRAPANHFGDHYQDAYDTLQIKSANPSAPPNDDMAGTLGDPIESLTIQITPTACSKVSYTFLIAAVSLISPVR